MGVHLDLGKQTKMRFHVLMAASMKMTVFWVVMLCSLMKVYWCFRCACCLHCQGNEAVTCHPDGGDSKHHWSVSELVPNYIIKQPGRQSSSNTKILVAKPLAQDPLGDSIEEGRHCWNWFDRYNLHITVKFILFFLPDTPSSGSDSKPARNSEDIACYRSQSE
jgi:hypothetical protein